MHVYIFLFVFFMDPMPVIAKLIFSERNISEKGIPKAIFKSLDLSYFSNFQGAVLLLCLIYFLSLFAFPILYNEGVDFSLSFFRNTTASLFLLPVFHCCTKFCFWALTIHFYMLFGGTNPKYNIHLRPVPDGLSYMQSGLRENFFCLMVWMKERVHHRKQCVHVSMAFSWLLFQMFFGL